MACFIVPGTEAIVTTAITKIVEKKEKKERESKHLFADYAHHHCRGQRGIACELGFFGKQGNGSGGCDRGG